MERKDRLKAVYTLPDRYVRRDIYPVLRGGKSVKVAIAGFEGMLCGQGHVGGILKEMGYFSDQVYKFVNHFPLRSHY